MPVRGPTRRAVALVQFLRARGLRSPPEAAAAKVDENKSSRFPNAPSHISDPLSQHRQTLFLPLNRQTNAGERRLARNSSVLCSSTTSEIEPCRVSPARDVHVLRRAPPPTSQKSVTREWPLLVLARGL